MCVCVCLCNNIGNFLIALFLFLDKSKHQGYAPHAHIVRFDNRGSQTGMKVRLGGKSDLEESQTGRKGRLRRKSDWEESQTGGKSDFVKVRTQIG